MRRRERTGGMEDTDAACLPPEPERILRRRLAVPSVRPLAQQRQDLLLRLAERADLLEQALERERVRSGILRGRARRGRRRHDRLVGGPRSGLVQQLRERARARLRDGDERRARRERRVGVVEERGGRGLAGPLDVSALPDSDAARARGAAGAGALLRSRAPHDGHTRAPEASGDERIGPWQRGHFMGSLVLHGSPPRKRRQAASIAV